MRSRCLAGPFRLPRHQVILQGSQTIQRSCDCQTFFFRSVVSRNQFVHSFTHRGFRRLNAFLGIFDQSSSNNATL